jgi:hypothetical protein
MLNSLYKQMSLDSHNLTNTTPKQCAKISKMMLLIVEQKSLILYPLKRRVLHLLRWKSPNFDMIFDYPRAPLQTTLSRSLLFIILQKSFSRLLTIRTIIIESLKILASLVVEHMTGIRPVLWKSIPSWVFAYI